VFLGGFQTAPRTNKKCVVRFLTPQALDSFKKYMPLRKRRGHIFFE
jgi:hypothetical protein